MPTLLFRFPSRRYHATPWGNHVNEGLIEWPPSPWRILRGLLSVGYTSGMWNSSDPGKDARSLLESLASVLPSYTLPPAVGTHSRHYMPLARFKKGREDTTLVFDTWAHVDDGELAVTWNVELTDQEVELLAQLAERIGYLGRSESWVEARLADANEPVPLINCMYESERLNPGSEWEQVPLIATETPFDYTRWREGAIAQALAGYPLPEGAKPAKKLLSDRVKAEEPYPADIIACLQASTNWLRKCGWSQPPGSRRVLYWRRTDALEVGAPNPRRHAPVATPVSAMLLSMATASGNEHALPSVTRTLPQAEMLHRALVSFSERAGNHSPVLTGCDEGGQPLRSPHDHAHILPLDLDADDHLEHILVWAPRGMNRQDQASVRAVRRTFTKGLDIPLRIALVGAGALNDLLTLGGVYGEKLRAVLGSQNGASTWRSLTPFVPPRFIKKRGRNTIEGQIAAELAVRGYPLPDEIRLIDPHEGDHARRHRHFVRSRRGGPPAPMDCGFTLELRFSTAVKGPLCLGYGSHFGLGLFSSVRENES